MIASLFQHEFLRHALIAGLLASVACGVVGTFVVVRRMGFMAGGVAHSCYGGVGLGHFLGFSPTWGAALFGLVSAVGIGLVDRGMKKGAQPVIGAIWAGGMALGILLVALKPGYPPNLSAYLFGNILFVPSSDLWLMAALDAALLLVVALFYRPLVAVSFDEEFAAVGGLPVFALHLTLLVLVALTVVVLIRVVGIILVIALLTIPASIALHFARSLRRMMVLATLLGMAFCVSGLVSSYYLDLAGFPAPSGALIILTAVLVYGLVTLGARLLRRPHSTVTR